jgi:hypothetical protein
MSTALSFALTALLVDSILVIYAVYAQRWRLLALGVILGALLDIYIVYQGS